MSHLAKDQLLELMEYADGELDGEPHAEKRAALEAFIRGSLEAQAFLDEMDRLGEHAREAEPLALPDTALHFDVSDDVMSAIDELEAKQAETVKTTTSKRATGVKSDASAGSGEGAGVSQLELAREKRRRIGVVLATGLALAAGIALVMRTHPNEDPQKSAALQKPVVPVLSATLAIPGGPTPAASEAELAAAQAADKNQEPGVEVNISDSAQTGVSVFYLPGSDVASASAVVWIDDTAGGKE